MDESVPSTSVANSAHHSNMFTDHSVIEPVEPFEAMDSGGAEMVSGGGVSYRVPVVDIMRDNLDVQGNLTILQAQVLLEDAYSFRTVHHKLDSTSLRLYRFYHSLPIQMLLGTVLTVIHLLAFIETPSSLSWTADLRRHGERVVVPCWVTQTIELFCLLTLILDCCCKIYFFGQKRAFRNPWLLCYVLTLVVSILDWAVSTTMICHVFRVRRFLRPLFLLQHSSIMKKTIKCLRNSLSEVISVLLFLAILIYISTLIGMCVFPAINPANITAILTTVAPSTSPPDVMFGDKVETSTVTNTTPSHANTTTAPPIEPDPANREGLHYFRNFWTSLFSLLVLVTTANHPDIMMPIYNMNRLSCLFFIFFVVIGLFCLTNMLTAVVFNQFRGYFMTSIQTQLFRRRVGFRAAYTVLAHGREDLVTSITSENSDSYFNHEYEEGVPVFVVQRVVPGARMPLWKREMIMHALRTRTGILNYNQFHEVMSLMDETTRPQVELRPPWRRGPASRFLQSVFLSRWFDRFGMVICFTNIIVITVEVALRYDIIFGTEDLQLEYINAVFIAFYLVEQVCKLWANGFARYVNDRWNIFDLFLTFVLVMMELMQIIFTYSHVSIPNSKNANLFGLSFWDGARIVNLLIVIRFLRIVPRINSIHLVASTIRDLGQNLKSFAGVLIAAYYMYGLLGMEVFGGRIKYEDLLVNGTRNFKCGSYAQLSYWSNNFDDFAASLVTLWDIMVVNNWYVIVMAYVKAVGPGSYIYFIVWWLISVLVILNLVVALIIENFIQRWDKNVAAVGEGSEAARQEQFQSMSLYAMFKASLQEPPQEELLTELSLHPEFSNHNLLEYAS